MNWLTICNRWGETNQVIEVNTSKIKRYAIKECVQPYDEHEEDAVREWWRKEKRKEREALENKIWKNEKGSLKFNESRII